MLKVVVVEDEELVRKGIVLTVDWAGAGCAVVGEAANGEEGLEVIRRYRPDLIVTDIRMPKLDGIEMLRRLREEGNRAHVVFLTAYSDFSYAQSALKLGAADYLLKPFHDGELEETIARIRSRAQAAAPAAPAAPVLPEGQGPEKSKYVREALTYLSEHYNDPDISVSSVARSLGVSDGHLSHVFKKETSYTLSAYLTNYRMHKATELLRDCRVKVYEVAESVGYRDITYFSSAFKKKRGDVPIGVSEALPVTGGAPPGRRKDAKECFSWRSPFGRPMPQIWMPWSGSMSTSTTQRRPAPRRWAGCGACTPCAPPLRRRWSGATCSWRRRTAPWWAPASSTGFRRTFTRALRGSTTRRMTRSWSCTRWPSIRRPENGALAAPSPHFTSSTPGSMAAGICASTPTRELKHYTLQMIIAVGFKVNNPRAV